MKRLITSLFVLVLALGAAAPLAAQTSQDLTIELDAGYGGLIDTDAPAPVVVTVTNSGPDIKGSLTVSFLRGSGNWVSQDIDLPMGSRKRFVLWVSGHHGGATRAVASIRVNGDEVAATEQGVTPIDASVVLIGYVGEQSRLGLPDMTAALNRPANLAKMTPEQLPDLDGLLIGLDAIVLGPGEYTPAQVDAVRRWVVAGGTLLIDGGPDGRVGPELEGLLPATLGRVIDGAALGRREIERARRLTPLPGARSFPDETAPLWVERQLGDGVVRVNALPLGQLPVERGQRNFWSLRHQPQPHHMGVPWSVDLHFLRPLLPGLTLPTTSSLALFLAAYILLVGPANYLVLRRLDRREWAWITIPAGVLLFTAAAYVLGFGLRGGNVLQLDVSMVQAAPGETTGRAISTVGFAAIRRDSYTLSVESPSIGWLSNRQREGEHIRQDGAGFSAVELQSNVGEIRQVQAVSAVELSYQIDGAVGADGRVTMTNTGTNPIEKAFLVRGGRFITISGLAPGDTLEIDSRDLQCCFPQGVSADQGNLAEQLLLGFETERLGFAARQLPINGKSVLIIPSNATAIPVSLDHPSQSHSATIYLYYLPAEGER